MRTAAIIVVATLATIPYLLEPTWHQSEESGSIRSQSLMNAILNDDESAVREAISLDSSLVSGQHLDGFTPLTLAADQNDNRISRILLEAGADPDEKTKWGHVPLHATAIRDNHKLAELLIRHGGNVNATRMNVTRRSGTHPVSMSAAICTAAEHGAYRVVDILLRNDARIVPGFNDPTWSALHSACNPVFMPDTLHQRGNAANAKAISLLVEGGADLNLHNQAGEAPLHVAVGAGRDDVVDYLLSSFESLDENVQTKKLRYTALHVAMISETKMVSARRRRLCELLISHGVDPRIVDAKGQSAIELAKRNLDAHDVKALEALVKKVVASRRKGPE